MPAITAAVSAETKAEFNAMALARETTPSRLATSLIENFLSEQAGKSPVRCKSGLKLAAAANANGEARTEQVFVRLEPYYYAELGRLAAERNWYRGTYLANLFHAHADRKPVLCEVEINALRQVARQLADMGRNINQIAKKLNISLDHAHLVNSLDFDLVQILIEVQTNAVKDVLRANIRGWGISDVET